MTLEQVSDSMAPRGGTLNGADKPVPRRGSRVPAHRGRTAGLSGTAEVALYQGAAFVQPLRQC